LKRAEAAVATRMREGNLIRDAAGALGISTDTVNVDLD
jgi:hypothetical protein